ncbi:zinc-finger domain-containing protein [Pseudobacillus badius]|uniref:zinc-finger domain-containing protein n=1 Tax=Bacillus badius TaxID=1455 RepID=UPI003D33CAA3
MTITREERQELRIKACDIIDSICSKCELVEKNRAELGNKGAYNYCVRDCSVAKELQEIGKKVIQTEEEIEVMPEEKREAYEEEVTP